MQENIDELIKYYFDQKDILELKSNKKEKIGNTYLNFFTRRKTTEKKPDFNFGILFIIEIFMIILSFIMGNFYIAIFVILICIITLIVLSVLHRKSIKKWELVNKEYLEKVQCNEYLLKDIAENVNKILLSKKQYEPYFKIVQNKILSGEILTFDEAKLFLMNNIKNKVNLFQDYWVCDYCESYNNNNSNRCVYCGASKKK